MPKPITQKEYKAYREDRGRTSKLLNYFGGASNETKIAAKHFKQFKKRHEEENAAAIQEAVDEALEIKKKKLANLARTHCGNLKWSNLDKKKCPYCSARLLDREIRDGVYVCDKHPGPKFRIGVEKLKARLEGKKYDPDREMTPEELKEYEKKLELLRRL